VAGCSRPIPADGDFPVQRPVYPGQRPFAGSEVRINIQKSSRLRAFSRDGGQGGLTGSFQTDGPQAHDLEERFASGGAGRSREHSRSAHKPPHTPAAKLVRERPFAFVRIRPLERRAMKFSRGNQGQYRCATEAAACAARRDCAGAACCQVESGRIQRVGPGLLPSRRH
jgi:hypothetical protein